MAVLPMRSEDLVESEVPLSFWATNVTSQVSPVSTSLMV